VLGVEKLAYKLALSEGAWKVRSHCRDAPWGVSGAALLASQSPRSRGCSVQNRPFSPPRRRPAGRLYSGGAVGDLTFQTRSKKAIKAEAQ